MIINGTTIDRDKLGDLSTKEVDDILNLKDYKAIPYYLIEDSFQLNEEQLMKVMMHPDPEVRKWAPRRAEFKPDLEKMEIGLTDKNEHNRADYARREDWEFTTQQILRGLEDESPLVRRCFIKHTMKREQIRRMLTNGKETEIKELLASKEVADDDLRVLLARDCVYLKALAIKKMKNLSNDEIQSILNEKHDIGGIMKVELLKREDVILDEKLILDLIDIVVYCPEPLKIALKRDDLPMNQVIYKHLTTKVTDESLEFFDAEHDSWRLSWEHSALLGYISDNKSKWESMAHNQVLLEKFDAGRRSKKYL